MKCIVLQLFLMCLSLPGQSQWQQIPGLYGGSVDDFVTLDNYFFLSTHNGIYRSADRGVSWEFMGDIRPDEYLHGGTMITHNNCLYASAGLNSVEKDYHVFISCDFGETWDKLDIPRVTNNQQMVSNDFGIYLSSNDTIWISADHGQTWEISTITEQSSTVHKLLEFDGIIFVMDVYDIHKSDINSDTWTTFTPTGIELPYAFQAFGKIYMAFDWTTGRMTRSEDAGASWKMHESKPWFGSHFTYLNKLILGEIKGVMYQSVDTGKTFTATGFKTAGTISFMESFDDTLFMGSSHGLFKSMDQGITFQSTDQGIEATAVSNIAVDENNLWAVTSEGVLKMSKQDETWSPILRENKKVIDLMTLNDRIFVAEDDNKIIRSVDEGQTWKSVYSFQFMGQILNKFYGYDHSLFAGQCHLYEPKLFVTEDYGNSWDDLQLSPYYGSCMFGISMSTRLVANPYELYRSAEPNGWIKILETDTYDIEELIVTDELIALNLYSAGKRKYVIDISSDNGDTWKRIEPQVSSYSRKGLAKVYLHKDILMGSTYYGDVYISYDLGDHWELFNEGIERQTVNEIMIDDSYVYAATEGKGVCRRSINDLESVRIDENRKAASELSIIPNPASNSFSISFTHPSDTKGSMVIWDMRGTQVFTTIVQSNQRNEIQINGLPPGMYFISVQHADNLYTGKLILLN